MLIKLDVADFSSLFTRLILVRLVAVGFVFGTLMLSSGCGNGAANGNKNGGQTDEDILAAPPVNRGVQPKADAQVAVVEFADPGAYGKLVIELYPNVAPLMVERFKTLIKEGFYNGTAIHRIDPDLGIIQGGDPLSKDADPANDGSGDSPRPNVQGEFSDISFTAGIVGAARKGAGPGLTEKQSWDTANCQFFVTLKPQPAFDQRYTVFGKVIQGLNNASTIAGAPIEPSTDRPQERIAIKSITLEDRAAYVK